MQLGPERTEERQRIRMMWNCSTSTRMAKMKNWARSKVMIQT